MIDGDIYGPNVPIMLGIKTQLTTDGQKIVPAEQYGIQLVSMAFLTQDDAPVIWRGPMLHGVVQQFFREVAWKDVDYLIVDLPPGTGDVALSLSQSVPVAGAVVVTTPQTVSLADTRRAVKMYEKLNVPPLGLIENMSHFVCPTLPDRERHLREGRRRGAGDGNGRAVSRSHSDLRADPHRRRHRRPDRRRRAEVGGSRRVPRRGIAACRAVVDLELQAENSDSFAACQVSPAHGSRLTAHGSRLTAHGSRLMRVMA